MNNLDAILFNLSALKAYLNCGRPTAEKIAKEAGAIRKFGRTTRYYRPAIDEYLKNQNHVES